MPFQRETLEYARLRQPDSGCPADFGHFRDLGMGKSGYAILCKQRQSLLRFPQRISEKHRRFTIRQGILHEAQHSSIHLHGAGEDEIRQPESCLHDECVRL